MIDGDDETDTRYCQIGGTGVGKERREREGKWEVKK